MTRTGAGEPEELRAVFVSGRRTTGARCQAVARAMVVGNRHWPRRAGAVVLLNYGYWQRRFGRRSLDRGANGHSRFALTTGSGRHAQRVPVHHRRVGPDCPDDDRPRTASPARLRFSLCGPAEERNDDRTGRRRPCAPRSGLDEIVAGCPSINPLIYENWRITPAIRPLKDDVAGNVGSVLWIVMGTIGIVMMIVSANVANLMLVRVQGRQQELAVRAALGAAERKSFGNSFSKAFCWEFSVGYSAWASRAPACVS